MPELPEVETVRRVLIPQIADAEIETVTVFHPQAIAYPSPDLFCTALIHQKISGMDRRGKFLIVRLAGGDRLLVHLRMTGCLLATPYDMELEKHTHVIFGLNNRRQLRFTDFRRFGRFWLIRNGEDDALCGIQKLGIEPDSPILSVDYLKTAFGARRKAIKECLLEQGAVAGIGNIYSDEILFEAGICPNRPAADLSDAEWHVLVRVIPERISYFTEKNAISPAEYLAGHGQDYRNTPYLQVYGRAGESCTRCGTILQRIVIAGRSSVFCAGCQV